MRWNNYKDLLYYCCYQYKWTWIFFLCTGYNIKCINFQDPIWQQIYMWHLQWHLLWMIADHSLYFICYNVAALNIITGSCTCNSTKQHAFLIKLECQSGSVFNCLVFGARGRGLVVVAWRLKQCAKWSVPVSGWFRSLLSPAVINRTRRESMRVPALYCSLRFMCQSREWLYVSGCCGNQSQKALKCKPARTHTHTEKKASGRVIQLN